MQKEQKGIEKEMRITIFWKKTRKNMYEKKIELTKGWKKILQIKIRQRWKREEKNERKKRKH